jgi:Tol biopolymer transport system component
VREPATPKEDEMRSSHARHAFAVLGPLLLAAAVLSASGQQSPRELYERARLLDEGGQNLAEVIRLYGQVADLAKDQPALAARALVQMGRCQERLGQAEARKAYQRVIDEYPGQQEEVAIARERLSQLARAAAAAPAQPRFRKIQIPAALSPLGPTPNGPAHSFGARLSPDGKTLAFSSEGAIWTVPVPGKVSPDLAGEPRRLTGAMYAMGLGLAWSADGRWVAFHAVRGDGGKDIYVVPSQGGEPVRVASRQLLGLASYPYDSTLALSLDGGIVAFSSRIASEKQVSSLEGESLCLKTVRVGDAAVGCVTDPDTAEPAFSPDGRRLAYVKFYRRGATPPPGSPLSGIRVMPASGSWRDSVGVTTVPNRANRPLWSPDGQLIAYLGGPANRTDELWIVPVSDDGRGTAAPASFKMPRATNLPLAGWTSDNKIGLVFESLTEQAIYTVPAEGGKATQITPQGAFEFPRWSPDGQSIWFLTADTASALGSVAAGGGAATTIRTGSNPPVQAVGGSQCRFT